MKEFIQSEARAETAVLVALITKTQDERKTDEYLDELEFSPKQRGHSPYADSPNVPTVPAV